MAGRRARAEEYAQRLNAAAALLRERSPAEAARLLADRYALSRRQARRYVRAAQSMPEGVAVPEASAVFTVRLPLSLIAGLRSLARANARSVSGVTAEAEAGVSRSCAGRASRWQRGLRSSSSPIGWRGRGWRRPTRCLSRSGGG